MAEIENNPIAGKGSEMLPEKGNPFLDFELPKENGSEKELREWDRERVNDLASSQEGRSSRLPRNPTPEETTELLSKPAEILPEAPLSGSIHGDREAVGIPTAALPAAPPAEDEIQTIRDRPEDSGYTAHEPIPTKPSIENQRRLLHRIEDAHWKISDSIDDIDTAKELLDMVQQAIFYVNSKNADTGKAERILYEVEFRISLAERMRRWSREAGRFVLWYEIAWALAIIAAFILLPLLRILPEAVDAVIATLLGGMGAVFGALFSLWRRVSVKQDYNPKHNPWYFMQPITGLAIGGFVFLVYLTVGQLAGGVSGQSGWTMLVFLLCAIFGSQQAFLFGLPARMKKPLEKK